MNGILFWIISAIASVCVLTCAVSACNRIYIGLITIASIAIVYIRVICILGPRMRVRDVVLAWIRLIGAVIRAIVVGLWYNCFSNTNKCDTRIHFIFLGNPTYAAAIDIICKNSTDRSVFLCHYSGYDMIWRMYDGHKCFVMQDARISEFAQQYKLICAIFPPELARIIMNGVVPDETPTT